MLASPFEFAKLRVLEHHLIVFLDPHLPLVATGGVPVKFVALDCENLARRLVADPRNAPAINFHNIPTSDVPV